MNLEQGDSEKVFVDCAWEACYNMLRVRIPVLKSMDHEWFLIKISLV